MLTGTCQNAWKYSSEFTSDRKLKQLKLFIEPRFIHYAEGLHSY